MKKLKIADKIIIGMFFIGSALVITQKFNNQIVPENSVAEISPQQVDIVEPAS